MLSSPFILVIQVREGRCCVEAWALPPATTTRHLCPLAWDVVAAYWALLSGNHRWDWDEPGSLHFHTCFSSWLLLSHFGGSWLKCVEEFQVPWKDSIQLTPSCEGGVPPEMGDKAELCSLWDCGQLGGPGQQEARWSLLPLGLCRCRHLRPWASSGPCPAMPLPECLHERLPLDLAT